MAQQLSSMRIDANSGVANDREETGVDRIPSRRLTSSTVGHRLFNSMIGVIIICAVTSLTSSVASAATPKANKQVVCSSIVTTRDLTAATHVKVGSAINGNTGSGPVHFPFTVPFYQLTGRSYSIPGSTCEYDYASGNQGDPNVSGPEVAIVEVGFGPLATSAWNNYQAWQRQHAFAGAVGRPGALGTVGRLALQALNLGPGIHAFEASLSGYYKNTQTGKPVTIHDVYVLTRHGNLLRVELSPVLVTTAGESDSSTTMEIALVNDALQRF